MGKHAAQHVDPHRHAAVVSRAARNLATTAYECAHQAEIPSLTLGRRVLITRRELEQLLGPLTATNPTLTPR